MPGTFVFKPIEATINGRATIGFNPENLDPYCKVKVGNVALNTHPSRNFGPHPQWTDDLVVQQGEDNYCTVTVKDKNKGTLGEVKLNLDEIEAKGKVAQWYNIYKDKNVQGQLMLEVVYTNANPQSRSWLQSSREGAAIATNNTPFIKGHHVSTAEIPHFRIPTTVHSHTAEHQMADIRKHLGANNIVARYALEHLKKPEVPEDHTAIKHEIERQNVKALNSSHKKTGNVRPRQYSPSERPSTVTTTPSQSQVDKLVHSTVKEVANIKAHQEQQRIHPILKTNDQERFEASQHVPQISDTRRVHIIDTVEPATRKDVSEVAKHMGQPGHFAGHSSLKKGNVRVQREDAGTGPLVYPLIESYSPEIMNPGYAHAGHSSIQAKGHMRVERDETGVSVVYPKVDYVEDVYEAPVQSNYGDLGHAHAGHASLQQHGQVRVQRPNVYDIPQQGIVPGSNWVSHVQDNYAVGNNAYAGHSSLQAKGHARVERDATGVSVVYPKVDYVENVYNAPVQGNYADAGHAHAGHSSLQHGHVRVQGSDAYDAASSCSGCTASSCSAYEGTSNPNTVGMTREALKGVDMFNRQERQFDREYASLVSGVKPGKKDDYWYLNSLGLSDPNTAKLGVNHRADRLGLADQKHHHHHHHHHHHGHGGVVENPTLADINSLGSGARVRKY